MAKSTRSKVKRHFRAKKREEGVYAATEAARLHRLHQKLKIIATTDKEGDIELEDAEVDAEADGDAQQGLQGWSWYTFLGLVDQDDLCPDFLGDIYALAAKSS